MFHELLAWFSVLSVTVASCMQTDQRLVVTAVLSNTSTYLVSIPVVPGFYTGDKRTYTTS